MSDPALPGRLTPRRLLGFGSYAQVWLATQARQRFALKVWDVAPRHVQAGHDKQLRRATELGFGDFMPRLVRSCEGASLLEYRAGVRLCDWVMTATIEERCDVADRVAGLVARWDAAGFKHGDLSDENVLVGKGCVVTIIDPHHPSTCSNMTGLINVMHTLIRGEPAPELFEVVR